MVKNKGSKSNTGLGWYNYVYNFLKSNECYLVITKDEKQKKSLISLINSQKEGGMRIKAERKKYGLYVSRGKRGNAAIVKHNIVLDFCKSNNLVLEVELKKETIIRFTAELFRITRELKNNYVHSDKATKGLVYSEQLETKEWLRFRRLIFSIKGNVCEMCGNHNRLQVHHVRYISGRRAWEYTPDDVMVLCRECHRKVHGII